MGKKKNQEASVEERMESRSAYEKIPQWLENNKDIIARKQKTNVDGEMVDKNPSLFPCIKATVFNQSKLKGHPYDNLCACVKYLVENVMNITPATFYNIYNTQFLKEYKLYSGIMHLIDEAPEEVQKECYFNHKDILFKSVWPEFYEKNIAGSITPYDILFANNEKKDMFKSCIIRAGQVKTISSKDKGTKYGAAVDEILFDAIKEQLFAVTGQCETIPDAFYVLGEYSKKKEENGGNDIAISRGYKSILDFFYLNLPEDFQVKYGLEYLDAREACGLSREPVLEIAILTRLGEVDRLRQYAFMGGDDEVLPEEYDAM